MSSNDDRPWCLQKVKRCIERVSSRSPCAECAPSLYFEPGTDEDLCIRIGGTENGEDYNRAYVFTVVCLGSSTHDWELSDEQKQDLVKNIELNGGEQASSDGRLTLSEMLDFVDDPDSREIVEALPGAIHGLLNKELVKEAFSAHDADQSGYLDLTEFSSFVDVLEELHFQYLLASAFQTFRAFFGRGQAKRISDLMKGVSPTACVPHKPEFESSTLQIGIDPDCNSVWEIPPGWLQDFSYYSANNHPLHGIFACDAHHPFSWVERLAVELATIVFSFLTTYQEVNVLVVTIAGTFMWNVLFLSFTSPCLRADAADSSPEVYRRNEKISRFISLAAYLCVIIGIIVVLSYGADKIPSHAWQVIQGRCLSYLLFWAMMCGIYFNLFIAWGQTDPHGSFSLGNYVGLGQWRIEKQRFRTLFTHRLQVASSGRSTADLGALEPASPASTKDRSAANVLPDSPQKGLPSADLEQSKAPPIPKLTDGMQTLRMVSPQSMVWLGEACTESALREDQVSTTSQEIYMDATLQAISCRTPPRQDPATFNTSSPSNYLDVISPRPRPGQAFIIAYPASSSRSGWGPHLVPQLSLGKVDHTWYPSPRYPSGELADWLKAGGGPLPKPQADPFTAGASEKGSARSAASMKSISPRHGLNKISAYYTI